MDDLDEITVSICDKHYPKCGSCPIQEPCHSGTGARLTTESIGAWRYRVNRAAAAIGQKMREAGNG